MPYDISRNHPDAVASGSQIAALGFNNLPEGTQAWIGRRFAAEAKAYSNCIAAALQKFMDSNYTPGYKLLAQQQCKVVQNRLGQAQAKIKGQMTETDCLWVLEQLKSTAQFLQCSNHGVFLWSPVTIPDFAERLNPAWEEWQRKYGSTKTVQDQRRSM